MGSPLTRREFHKAVLAGVGAAGLLGSWIRPARAADTLTLQTNWLNDPEFLGYMLAIDKGYYAAEGLTVPYLSGGPNVIPDGSLITGKADIALTNMGTTPRAVIERGAPLKILGAQYQKSPVGVITLASTGIEGPKDLAGKTVAVSTLGISQFKAMLTLNGVQVDSMRIVPYTFNPAQLIDGNVDAAVDFVTQLPFMVEAAGKKTNSFLLYDHGLPFYTDLVVVTADTLKAKRAQLVKFLRASRVGWAENFKDPKKYPPICQETWFKGNGSSLAAEIYFNTMQQGLMYQPKGLFTMTEEDIARNLDGLARLGLKGNRDMFDTTVLAEV
jgi:ABC-type nitrate/sulfonate/bicarbonate transport system substrate-binding protein